MITWRKAPRVAPGDPITASQADQLAQAWNDRLRNGPSLPWRRVNHLLGAFRQMRNPDGSLTPSQAEFFQFYQHLNPTDAQWPDADPGLPAGANVASQWPAFVYGVDDGTTRGINSEADRLTNPAAGGLNLVPADTSPRALWGLAKSQRGAYDPTTGGLGSPAFAAAVSYSQVRYNATSPHGTDWGGYLGSPPRNGDCSTTTTGAFGDSFPIPNFTYLFTNLVTGATLTYGVCPENAGDLAGYVVTPFEYVLIFYSGAILKLPQSQWVEGPYNSNPQLRRTSNQFLGRGINRFVGDFRGTPAQQATDGIGADGADIQGFLTSQYLLAPCKGTENAGSVSPVYPVISASASAGTVWASGKAIGSGYAVSAGFTVAIVYVEARGLSGPAAVDVRWNGGKVATASLEKQVDGFYQAICAIPSPSDGGTITVTVADQVRFSANGSVRIELAELLTYKPNVADLYLVLRCGGIEFGAGGMDGSGVTCSYAASIVGAYFQEGVLTSIQGHAGLPGNEPEINSNAVFDAARRLSKCVRWVHRWNLVGYEVSGGNSILYFTRLARGLGKDVPLDIFDGIGPARSAIASGSIVWGRKYVVTGTSGRSVTYGGKAYVVEETFTGLQDVTTYTAQLGAEVWEAEGIRATAEPGQFTNEWLIGCEAKPYSTNEASIWKLDAFTDSVGNLDRCVLCDPAAGYDPVLRQHLAFGNALLSPPAILTPENPETWRYAPSGNNYYPRINRAVCDEGDATCISNRQMFYKSCPLFKAWPAVQSVTIDSKDVVKVTLWGRLHYDSATAPASVARDITTWNISGLRSQPYRTDENAVMEYLWFNRTGTNGSVKIGDQSWSQNCASLLDAPGPSICPTFYFVQLIPRPPVDNDGVSDVGDAVCFHDSMALLELDLRAGCSAFVDGQTTLQMTCANAYSTDLFDFTWEQLMIQATGFKWMAPTATQTTDALSAGDVRPDSVAPYQGRPFGFGPLPSVYMTAEVFNWYASAIDLLDTFRVMVPATLQFKQDTGSNNVVCVSYNAAGQVAPPNAFHLGTAGYYALYAQGVFPTPPLTSFGTFVDASNGTSQLSWGLATAYSLPHAGAWEVNPAVAVASYRWSPENADFDLALCTFSGALSSNPAVFGQMVTTIQWFPDKPVVSGAHNGTQVNAGGGGSDDVWSTGNNSDNGGAGSAIRWGTGVLTVTTGVCQRFSSGTIPVPALPGGYTFSARNNDAGTDITNSGGPVGINALTVTATTTPSITVQLV